MRVVVIGHFVTSPVVSELPKDSRRAEMMVSMSNYTRVVTDDGQFIDHVELLSRQQGRPAEDPLSVWNMHLTAGLLLSSHLRRHGFTVKRINTLASENDPQLDEIEAFNPDIIAVSTTFVLTSSHLKAVGSALKRRFPDTFVVAGGHHVSTTLMKMNDAAKAAYLKSSGVDAFVDDVQGEAALLELCQNFPDKLDTVANVIWRRPDGEILVNPRVPEENDVNETLIEFDDLEPGSIVHIRTARSCSFKCAFCSYPTIAGPLASMDLDHVMVTLRKAKAAGAAAVFFVDDTFNVPKKRFEKLVDLMIAEDLEIPWYSFLRCQYVDENLVKKMRKSGCAGVFLGVESGSDKILKNMKKGAIASFYKDGIRWLKEAGIITVGAFIIGFPGETPETVEETKNFIETFGLDFYFMQPFYFLHHTPIFKRAEDYGLTGEGFFWSHATMDSVQAHEHLRRLFREIKNSVFVNPDYTLWEVVYLLSKGMSLSEFVDYRKSINDMTINQIDTYLSPGSPRDATKQAADQARQQSVAG
ncbi:MAG: radical SAM protein [Rhodospirillales bacterium]|nr:radical SAM protein [Rhodospirillales bacterium]